MNNADVAWILMSTALVLLMTPALAFFYGGLVRSKNALNTMMMSVVALGFAAVAWALAGYSIAFAPGTAYVGGLSYAVLRGVGLEAQGTIPHVLFMAFQGTFAIITVALISGAIVERMRFSAYLLFIVAWVLFVYAPVVHWVWGGGWLASLGALDFAGGTVVHVNAAAAALTAALVIGARKDHGRQAFLPHNVPFTLLGAGLLWFGWFGFNAGSALAANEIAALAFANTMLAPAATLVVWTLLDLMRTGRVTAVGAATAIVVGLVAITPAAGFISPTSSLALGAIAAVPSYFALLYRTRTRLDDSLDVVAAHGVGGMVGAMLTGVFADPAWSGGASGLLTGNASQVGVQAAGVVVVLLYSVAATFTILKVIGLVVPLRASVSAEGRGLDVSDHGEEAYAEGDGAILVGPEQAATFAQVVATARTEGGPRMKLIVAIIRPDKLNDVLEALFRAQICGLTISRVQGHGGETEHVENYRGTTVKMALLEKVRIEIAVSQSFVEPTIKAIADLARTGEVGDGKIFVLPLDTVYRIRTGELDQDAVTPVVAV